MEGTRVSQHIYGGERTILENQFLPCTLFLRQVLFVFSVLQLHTPVYLACKLYGLQFSCLCLSVGCWGYRHELSYPSFSVGSRYQTPVIH